MGTKTGIEWTDATWNPWVGCTKVSPACADCYMFRDMRRFGKDPETVTQTSPHTFGLPLNTDRSGNYKIPAGSKVFTCSYSDWFHKDADGWRPMAWKIVRRRPDLIFQIVTKRTERILECLPYDWGDGYPNVWLIATTENQQWFTKRITDLYRIPCAVRGLSIEPLLGPLTIKGWESFINWVIVGGESGTHARITRPNWVQDLRDECAAASIPFFFKQWGEFVAINQAPPGVFEKQTDDWTILRPGKKAAGRMLDGVEWSEFPEVPIPF